MHIDAELPTDSEFEDASTAGNGNIGADSPLVLTTHVSFRRAAPTTAGASRSGRKSSNSVGKWLKDTRSLADEVERSRSAAREAGLGAFTPGGLRDPRSFDPYTPGALSGSAASSARRIAAFNVLSAASSALAAESFVPDLRDDREAQATSAAGIFYEDMDTSRPPPAPGDPISGPASPAAHRVSVVSVQEAVLLQLAGRSRHGSMDAGVVSAPQTEARAATLTGKLKTSKSTGAYLGKEVVGRGERAEGEVVSRTFEEEWDEARGAFRGRLGSGSALLELAARSRGSPALPPALNSRDDLRDSPAADRDDALSERCDIFISR
eukprot:tig00021441_g21543.t1